MFAKTLVLAGSVMALALIPTAAAEHINSQPSCSAFDGHEDIGVLYNPEVYLQCAGIQAFPQVTVQKPALPLPAHIPQVNDAGCIAAEGFEAVCAVYNVATQGLPLADAGCIAAEGFEAVCAVYNVATQGLPLADAGCIAAEGFEPVCTVYDAALGLSQPRAAGTGVGVAPPCVAVYPWSQVCDLPPL